MKIKSSFVTNSSSSSYLIENMSLVDNLTAITFVEGIWDVVKEECKKYGFIVTKEGLIKALEEEYPDYFPLGPNEESELSWGDEDDTLSGHVLDYTLREGVNSDQVRVTLIRAR